MTITPFYTITITITTIIVTTTIVTRLLLTLTLAPRERLYITLPIQKTSDKYSGLDYPISYNDEDIY